MIASDTTAIAQLAAAANGGLDFGPPIFTLDPYVGPEIYELDPVDTESAVLGQSFPTPTLTAVRILLDGISQGATYTTVIGDADKSVIVPQTADGGITGQVTHASPTVVIQAFRSFGNMGGRGGNVSGYAEYSQMRMFGNAALEGRGFAAQCNTYPIVAGNATLTLTLLSGSSYTLTLGSNVGCLSGNSSDVGLIFQLGSAGTSNGVGVYATVTSFTDTTHATVTVTGTLTGTMFLATNWFMTLATDSDGWPTMACNSLITATPGGGADGQLGAGTYYGTFTEKVPASPITVTGSGSGFTVTDMGVVGSVHTFKMVVASGGVNGQLAFSGGFTDLVVARDGTIQTSVPQFNPDCTSFHAQFDCLRFMDFLNTNNRLDATWSDAQLLNRVVPQSAQTRANVNLGGHVLSWETWVDFVEAVYAVSGSKLKAVHICIPLMALASSYKTNLSNMISARHPTGGLATGAIQIHVERGNEEWNPGFYALGVNGQRGEVAAQALGNYGNYNYVTSATVAAGGVVTVNTSVPLSSFPSLMGLTITPGTQFYVSVQGGHAANWGMNPSVPATPVATVLAVTGANQFTYQGIASNPDSSIVGLQFGMFFNLSSPLVADGLVYNIFYLGTKTHILETYNCYTAWTRPGDKFLLGLQFGVVSPPVNANGANSLLAVYFPYQYAQYLGGGSLNWLYSGCVAPYINGQFLISLSASAPFQFPAGLLADQDVVGIGTNSNTAVVAKVSVSGTTATLQGPSTFAVSSITQNPSGGNSTATVTSTTGFLGQGQQISGTGITSTTLGAQLTGTPGGVGTYTVIGQQNTGALSGLTSAVPSITNASINCIIYYPNAAGSGARLIAAMVRNLQPGFEFYQQIQLHAFQAKQAGKPLYCYEGGPDLSVTAPNMQLTVQTDSTIGTMVTAMLDACFQQGVTIFNWYQVTPGVFSNGTNGGWNICQTYADTTSPKLVAYLNYNTPYSFATQSGSPGTALVSQCQNYSAGSYGSGAGAANYRFNSYAVENFTDVFIGVPRTRRYMLTPWGTDSVRTDPAQLTPASLYLDPPLTGGDGTLLGTFNVPANGASATNAALACSAIRANLTSGVHILRIRLHANAGVATGFSQIVAAKY